MKPKKRQKLCYNCDGEIDLDVIVCPYCAADLREEKPEEQRSAILSGSVRPQGGEPPSIGLLPSEQKEEVIPSIQEGVQEISQNSSQSMVGTVLLLTAGVQLMLLGLLLVFLADNGTVTLRWDARLWFLYVFASVPFLVFGYRSLSKI